MLPDDLWVIRTGVSDLNKPQECGRCTGRDWETTPTAGSHQHITTFHPSPRGLFREHRPCFAGPNKPK